VRGSISFVEKMKKILLVFSCFILHLVFSSPNGAPATQAVCESMAPNHGVSAQNSPSPYHLEVSSLSAKSGDVLKIQITSDEGKDFRGFLLLARTNEPEFQVLGEFEADEDESTPFNHRDCYGKTRNAVTHTSRELKTKIGFKWKVPADFTGSIHFRLVESMQGEVVSYQ
jgi:hypothetical protein